MNATHHGNEFDRILRHRCSLNAAVASRQSLSHHFPVGLVGEILGGQAMRDGMNTRSMSYAEWDGNAGSFVDVIGVDFSQKQVSNGT